MTQDGLQGLVAFRGRLHDKLMLIPEYRAISVIDRTIEEISQIFDTKAPVLEQPTPAVAKEAPIARAAVETAPINDVAQSRIAMAIAEAIETNVSQIRTTRIPPPPPYTLVGAAS